MSIQATKATRETADSPDHAPQSRLPPVDPIAAEAGSIRGDFGVIVRENLIHASDSEESAEREPTSLAG